MEIYNDLTIAEGLKQIYRTYMNEQGGFLPNFVPLDTLPKPFHLYVETVNNLHEHYASQYGGVRAWMDSIFYKYDEALNTVIQNLNNKEKQKLMTVLTVLAHTYRWDSMPPQESAYALQDLKFPNGIDIPFTFLALLLQQPKCGTLWNMTLCNWTLKNKPCGSSYLNEDLTFENMQVAHQWFKPPMAQQLEHWILVFVLIEAKGAPVLKKLVELVEASAKKDQNQSINLFSSVAFSIKELIAFFNQEVQFKKIDQRLWREWVQPTFIWGLDTGEGKLEGASGLQVGIIHSIDVAFNIESNTQMAKAAIQARKYMPNPHRLFLSALDKARPIIRNYVIESRNEELKRLYNESVITMRVFRASHKAKGAAYIKGDGTEKALTTTGLTISDEKDSVKAFRDIMDERLQETNASLLS